MKLCRYSRNSIRIAGLHADFLAQSCIAVFAFLRCDKCINITFLRVSNINAYSMYHFLVGISDSLVNSLVEKVRRGGANVELKGKYIEMMPDELRYFLLPQTIATLSMN